MWNNKSCSHVRLRKNSWRDYTIFEANIKLKWDLLKNLQKFANRKNLNIINSLCWKQLKPVSNVADEIIIRAINS